jgi:hypothetical protein
MIVRNLDVFGSRVRPTEAKAKLIVNTNAVLARAVPLEGFQSIARRKSQIVELARDPNCRSLRGATVVIFANRPTGDPLASASVSAHLNALITH